VLSLFAHVVTTRQQCSMLYLRDMPLQKGIWVALAWRVQRLRDRMYPGTQNVDLPNLNPTSDARVVQYITIFQSRGANHSGHHCGDDIWDSVRHTWAHVHLRVSVFGRISPNKKKITYNITSTHYHVIISSYHHHYIITSSYDNGVISSHNNIIPSLHHHNVFSHLRIITSSHHRSITSSHHIIASSHHHILTSTHHHIITSHQHIIM